MKHSIKRISKSALSVILALMMVVSTMAVGMVTTNAASSGTITVYFKNALNWSKVYVYFYSSAYWDKDKGSDSNGIAGGPHEMTKVVGSKDIYSYTYNGTYSQYISFTKDKQEGYEKFYSTSAAYRGDFNVSTPLYTPSTTSTGTYNGTVYYNNGTWSAYSGLASSQKTIVVSYDAKNERNYCHIWYNDDGKSIIVSGTDTTNGPMTQVSGITGLYYKDITDKIVSDNSNTISFISKIGSDWNNKSEDISVSGFKNGGQAYIYRNSSDTDSSGLYTPLSIKSLSTTEVTSGQDNTITFLLPEACLTSSVTKELPRNILSTFTKAPIQAVHRLLQMHP